MGLIAMACALQCFPSANWSDRQIAAAIQQKLISLELRSNPDRVVFDPELPDTELGMIATSMACQGYSVNDVRAWVNGDGANTILEGRNGRQYRQSSPGVYVDQAGNEYVDSDPENYDAPGDGYIFGSDVHEADGSINWFDLGNDEDIDPIFF
jgi:hypothetical protein